MDLQKLEIWQSSDFFASFSHVMYIIISYVFGRRIQCWKNWVSIILRKPKKFTFIPMPMNAHTYLTIFRVTNGVTVAPYYCLDFLRFLKALCLIISGLYFCLNAQCKVTHLRRHYKVWYRNVPTIRKETVSAYKIIKK